MNTLLLSAYNVTEFVILTGVHVILRDLTNYYWNKDKEEIVIDDNKKNDNLINNENPYLITPENESSEIIHTLGDEGAKILETNEDGSETIETLEYGKVPFTSENDGTETAHTHEDDRIETSPNTEGLGSEVLNKPTDDGSVLLNIAEAETSILPKSQSDSNFHVHYLDPEKFDTKLDSIDSSFPDIYAIDQLKDNIEDHENDKVHIKELDISTQENSINFNEEDLNVINIPSNYNVKLTTINNMVLDLEYDLKRIEETHFYNDSEHNVPLENKTDYCQEYKTYTELSVFSQGDHTQIPQSELYFSDPTTNSNPIVDNRSALEYGDPVLGIDCTTLDDEYRCESADFLPNWDLNDLNVDENQSKRSYTLINANNISETECDCTCTHPCLQYISSDDEQEIITDSDDEELLLDHQLQSVETGSVSDWLYSVNPDIIRQSSNINMNTRIQGKSHEHSEDQNLTYQEQIEQQEIFLKTLFVKKWLKNTENNYIQSCYGFGDYNEF